MTLGTGIPLFLATFIRHPLRIGSIAPSSRFLGKNIAAAMIDSFSSLPYGPPHAKAGLTAKDALVVELGAGTGAITRELVAAGIRPDNLAINELDPVLLDYLRNEFPRSALISGDATQVSGQIPSAWLGRVAAVVSSLPLRIFPDEIKTQLVTDIFKMLRPDGVLVQYTYPLACPLAVHRLGLRGERYKRVWLNLPPAAIWCFRKQRLDGVA
ncbi:MAG: methyltransferase domain-containing protein [Candidatus Symbiobacter sp.]|nr:methyltransferase domain-containing protein [Candidatus Symbiobacter sp.]